MNWVTSVSYPWNINANINSSYFEYLFCGMGFLVAGGEIICWTSLQRDALDSLPMSDVDEYTDFES